MVAFYPGLAYNREDIGTLAQKAEALPVRRPPQEYQLYLSPPPQAFFRVSPTLVGRASLGHCKQAGASQAV